MIIVLGIAMSAVLTVFPYLFYRNHCVWLERLRIIDEVYRLNMQDIEDGYFVRINPRRAIYHEGPSYEEMLYKFWRPVDSFFPPVEEWLPI